MFFGTSLLTWIKILLIWYIFLSESGCRGLGLSADQINSLGGLKAIVISHPHYYTTHLVWAKTFKCPIYLATEDKFWLCREASGPTAGERIFIDGDSQEILPGITAVKVGGHFPGSMVLHWEDMLFIADSFVTVPVCCPPDKAISGVPLLRMCSRHCTMLIARRGLLRIASCGRFLIWSVAAVALSFLFKPSPG